MRSIVLKLITFTLAAWPIFLPVGQASAHFHTDSYQYLVGMGTEGIKLCDLAENACPVLTEARHQPAGDRLELTGQGEFRVHPRLLTGSGTVVHKDALGNVVGQGTWTADRLLGFIPYGCGGEGLPDNFCGGLLIIRSLINPDAPELPDNIPVIMLINCLIGPHPEGIHEGVKIIVPQFGYFFDHEVSGLTLFIKTLPE